MKKIFRKIAFTLLWILYCLFTQDARQRYLVGKSRGKHCWKQSHGITATTLHFENKKPIREYMTWKEFRKQHKF